MAAGFRVNKAGMDKLLRGRTGPVALHTANVGRQIEGRARRLAPRRTGELRQSIGSTLVRGGKGWSAVVFAGARHAGFVHDGTKRHIIRATKPHGLLVFEIGGVTIFTRKPVEHPGTKPNRFLVRAAEQVGLKVRRAR